MFIDEESVVARERDFADGGLMDGRELARGFATLRPNDLIWPYVVNNYYLGKQAPPFDLLFWNSDSTNLPGRMFAEYLRQTYLENQIASAKARMCDTDVRLKTVKARLMLSLVKKTTLCRGKRRMWGANCWAARCVLCWRRADTSPALLIAGGRQRMALDGTRKKRTFGNGGEVAGDCKKSEGSWWMIGCDGWLRIRARILRRRKNSATPVMRPLKMRLVLMCALSCRMRERLMLAT